MLHKAANLEVTLIGHRNEIEKTHRYFIDFQSQIYVELFIPNHCLPFQVDSVFIIDEVLADFRRESMFNGRTCVHLKASIPFRAKVFILIPF